MVGVKNVSINVLELLGVFVGVLLPVVRQHDERAAAINFVLMRSDKEANVA